MSKTATRRKGKSTLRNVDSICIRLPSGASQIIEGGARLKEAAMRWTRILRNRPRWIDDPDSRARQQERITATLRDLSIGDKLLKELAQAETVEIRIPFTSENDLWEGRLFPWEPMLAEATHSLRHDHPLTVVRHLRQSASKKPHRPGFQRALYIEAAPGELKRPFSFTGERRLVRAGLKLKGKDFLQVINPTRAELSEVIETFAPDIVHVAGVDPHQAMGLLNETSRRALGLETNHAAGSESRVRDGIILSKGRDQLDLVPAAEAAALLCAKHSPKLVCFNIFNSAARLAALSVAEGADAAIGFQDDVKDDLAEMFYTNLYTALRQTEGHVFESFRFAWNEIHEESRRLQGTGVVLWGAHSWTPPTPTAESQKHNSESLEKSKAAVLTATKATLSGVSVEVQPVAQLNYSMLHNRRSLFERFVLRKPQGRMEDVSVTVQLDSGIPFRASITTERCPEDLGERICVPLTSALARSARENVSTTLRVEVTWKNRVLYHDTHRVTLLPVDEWRDDDSNRVWLPSFVLPRDPAVLAVIQLAEGALRTLEDNRDAGFDGYQRVEPTDISSQGSVDLQVRAIWSALAYQSKIAYVNPPPAYTINSQRLRMPCEIMAGGRGTCIDLALLLAACLEYVEIYPVVILLDGHAFAGYWRSPEAFRRFRSDDSAADAISDAAAKEGAVGAAGQPYPWYFERLHYAELLQEVHSGSLVPLETTYLTEGSSFADAIEEGANNLRSRAEFHSMIDILLAREHQVTPLPMRGEDQ